MKTKKDFAKIALIVTASLFVIGIILILCSGALGVLLSGFATYRELSE